MVIKRTPKYEVNQEQFITFHKTVEKLIKETFGTDSEDCPNVEFILIDRERYERMHYHPIPYEHKNDIDTVLDKAMSNLNIATDRVKTSWWVKQDELRESIKDKEVK